MRSPLPYLSFIAGIGVFISVLTIGSNAQQVFPDTLWVPVIFYDYHSILNNGGDFETCEDPARVVGRKGMVAPTLDADRKPIPIPSVACGIDYQAYPCACHLSEWFRPSGQDGSDNSCVFACDSLTDPDKPRWYWSGLIPYQGSSDQFTAPAFDPNYSMANIIIYDSIPFEFIDTTDGVYKYENDNFLPINGKGFGAEVSGYRGNYCFAMEMHTKFIYKKGLSFEFYGDDDVWAFIDGRLALDYGGTHSTNFDSLTIYTINLDTIEGLVPGQSYSFDFFYCERKSTGSNIFVNTNIISSRPNRVNISVFPSDTIKAGDTATIIGTVLDQDGKEMSIESDSITWTQVTANVRDGDVITTARDDTTKFTGTVAYRSIGIIGTYRSGTITILDTTWVYIKPADPSRVDISLQSATQLTREQAISGIDSFAVTPRLTVRLVTGQNNAYVYAVLRDRFGNLCVPADSAIWVSGNTAAATIGFTENSAFGAIIGRPAGVNNATTEVIASWGTLTPDTASVALVADTLTGIRLVDVNNPDAAISVIRMTTDSTCTVKIQGTWSNAPDTWVDITGTWVLDPPASITFLNPLPTGEAGQWTLDPETAGSARLTVSSDGISTMVHLIVSVADRQGPFVQRGVFTVGPLGGSTDTLVVTFSEPVNCDSLKYGGKDPASSFKVFGPGNELKSGVFDGAYYLDNSVCPKRFITSVTVITKTMVGGITPGKDSIVLYGNAVDTAGNYPDTSHRGPIVYGPGSGISVVPYRNTDPSIPPMVLPSEMVTRLGITGNTRQTKLIVIQTRGPLVPITGSDGVVSYGSVVIFDPVANVVAVDRPILASPFDERLYYILWDGTNRWKRKVASGAYLFRGTVRYAGRPETLVHISAKFSINWK